MKSIWTVLLFIFLLSHSNSDLVSGNQSVRLSDGVYSLKTSDTTRIQKVAQIAFLYALYNYDKVWTPYPELRHQFQLTYGQYSLVSYRILIHSPIPSYLSIRVLIDGKENQQFKSASGYNQVVSNQGSYPIWFDKGKHTVQVEYKAIGQLTKIIKADHNIAFLKVEYSNLDIDSGNPGQMDNPFPFRARQNIFAETNFPVKLIQQANYTWHDFPNLKAKFTLTAPQYVHVSYKVILPFRNDQFFAKWMKTRVMVNGFENVRFRGMSGSLSHVSISLDYNVWLNVGTHEIRVDYLTPSCFVGVMKEDWHTAFLQVDYN